MGYYLIVISNQAGIARGYFEASDVDIFHAELQNRLQAAADVRFDAIYYCPHHPGGKVPAYAITCDCRKPGTALLKKATEDFPIDLSRSFFVGDRHSDIECAFQMGIPGYQILSNQYEKHPEPTANIQSLADVLSYAAAILRR
jgi:D-glycero-D-manno-heptose 1,7-bisphosphate phosphatase